MTGPATLGIDFGTSNSAAGIAVAGRPYLIDLEPGEQTLPTAVFFEDDGQKMDIGRRATRALINGEEGRFMRALKSVLGTSLMHEERRIQGRRMTFVHIVARFLAELKTRAEAATGQTYTNALSGRPVRFHSADDARNARAEDDLRACYLAAGFEDVRFMFEPEAALRATPPAPGLGLIVDIGGGTSDFTAFDQNANGSTDILASHGVRVGGTDFDRRLSIDHVMPELGRGSLISNTMGPDALPAPARVFNDLATWAMIPFLYTPETRRLAADLARQAVEPQKLARLVTVLEEELGHDLAFAVERGKISVNAGEAARVALNMVERGLSVPLNDQDLRAGLSDAMDDIARTARETLDQAGIAPDRVDRIVLVGGSSLMHAVQDCVHRVCPRARIESGKALTGVADGLALAADSAFG
ncbi:MAG: hsp70 family protein [Rhodobacteraceae bacterium]|nr:hsp70 family protein [Paracoccaceae bacterium]